MLATHAAQNIGPMEPKWKNQIKIIFFTWFQKKIILYQSNVSKKTETRNSGPEQKLYVLDPERNLFFLKVTFRVVSGCLVYIYIGFFSLQFETHLFQTIHRSHNFQQPPFITGVFVFRHIFKPPTLIPSQAGEAPFSISMGSGCSLSCLQLGRFVPQVV